VAPVLYSIRISQTFKATMMRAKLMTLCTAGINSFHSTRFTVLLMLCNECYLCGTKPDMVFNPGAVF